MAQHSPTAMAVTVHAQPLFNGAPTGPARQLAATSAGSLYAVLRDHLPTANGWGVRLSCSAADAERLGAYQANGDDDKTRTLPISPAHGRPGTYLTLTIPGLDRAVPRPYIRGVEANMTQTATATQDQPTRCGWCGIYDAEPVGEPPYCPRCARAVRAQAILTEEFAAAGWHGRDLPIVTIARDGSYELADPSAYEPLAPTEEGVREQCRRWIASFA